MGESVRRETESESAGDGCAEGLLRQTGGESVRCGLLRQTGNESLVQGLQGETECDGSR